MQQHFRAAMARLENEHWWYRARNHILERAVGRLVGRTERALTIGVGYTREAEMLSKTARLVAIDKAPIDPRLRELALAAQADAIALPFSSETFDAAFMFDVLEHVDAEASVLREIHRVLRPGGKLVLSVPAFMFLYGLQDVVSEHKRRYRRGPLIELVTGSGFEVDHATYFNTLLFPPIAAIRILRKIFPVAKDVRSDFDVRLPGPAELVLEKLFSLERYAIDRVRLPFGVSILCSAHRP
ncbi:MAG TPA: methyltransferase domain-containing protein [Vicinamibacteria bacterium]|nr:methyltransferase domain-containing protein [Vicinamibacteria bacterium]